MRLAVRPPLRRVALATAALATGLGLCAAPANADAPTGTIDGANEAGSIKDSYIVVLDDDAVAKANVTATADALAARFGGDVTAAFTAGVKGFSVRMTEARAARLAADPIVASVSQDKKVSMLDT